MTQLTPSSMAPRENAEFVSHWKRIRPVLEENTGTGTNERREPAPGHRPDAAQFAQ
ncbi:MAG: hypothetical protein MK110_14100 [Fuerstiella sp.]|nr:hypothetical protein [Fuerstiella sp.]